MPVSKKSDGQFFLPFLPFLLGGLFLSLLASPAWAQATLPPASPDGVAQAVVREAGLEGRVLWVDGTANLQRLSSREGVAALLENCVRTRINTLVVDVKPLSGHVLYNSKVAPRLSEWRGFRYPAGFDLLRTVLDEGRRRGIKVYANINVFSDGHKLVGSGPAYEKPDQQAVIYDIERSVVTPRGAQAPLVIGTNRTPAEGQISLYDSDYRTPRVIAPDEAFALVINSRVEALVDGTFAPAEGVTVPRDGYLLIGRGEGAR
jgi:hypothetical protein